MSHSTTTQETSRNTPPPAKPHSCAACKHQRRKCTTDCILAPYFPPTATSQFLNAHKLFGVKKIINMLRTIPDPAQRNIAAQCIIVQANARAADPAGGCLRVVHNLHHQINNCLAELRIVREQLAQYKAQEHNFFPNNTDNNYGFDIGSYHDMAYDDQMIIKMLDHNLAMEQYNNYKRGFQLRNNIAEKDVELEQEVDQEVQSEERVAPSQDLSS